jgi:hypothetical protein
MRDPRRHWLKAVEEMMQRTRLPFRECCRRVGARGGVAAASQQRALQRRRTREEAMGLQ